ncbi:ATP-binding cassette sub-family A member 12 [Gymnodraco acuticeps]|uniref:ATP-binding cassette sub-family A member 12 n=1 Tax=Gymnodraco acuticeps TaxID=8218 RepID=A0A6P8T8F2_GYMAC|nr:ATP-binding cassette sub-family A member 12 [Gymnodraco acuticeps]
MIQSLQMPVVVLMREIAQSANSTHFNLSEISQRMQPAIEHTLELAEQANGTLKCSEVLIAWEPVREAAGLSPSTMSMWCNIHLQPVLEAYAEAQTVYALMNTSHMGVGPMTVSATAARIVKSVQSLYHANMNSSIVSQQLIMVIVSQLSGFTGQSLSPEAELYWYKQLQDVQLLNSLNSFKMLSDELVNVAPFIQPYTDALEEALNHILGNYDLFEDSSSSEDIFREAAMIFLSSANITLDNSMMSGNFSGLNVESLTNMIKEAVQQIIDMQIFGNEPMLYQALEQFLASNESSMIVQKVFDLVAWLASTKSSGFDLLTQVLPKIYDIVRPLLSVLTQLGLDMSENMELFEDLAGNIIAMLRQLVSTSGLLSPKDHRPSMYGMSGGNHTTRVRNRREAPSMMARDPMDDFIDLFYIDYPTMFKAISVPVSTNEILETVHVFFANPDMNVVVKGVTSDMPWGLNASREDTIDAALGLLSFVTLPSTFQMSSMDLLSNAAAMLPDGFPFSTMLKHITRVLAGESQENLMLMQETIQTAIELFQISLTDPRFTEQLSHLGSKVCAVEQTESVRLLMLSLSIEPGQLCNTILPSLQMLVESLMMNTSYLSDAIFQTAIGEPTAYSLHSNWSSLLSQGLGFNTSNLSSLDINITSPGVVTVGELLRNETAFLVDVQKHMDFDPDALHLLMETILPNNNLEILSWLVNLRHCGSTEALEMKETDLEMLKTFCSLSVEQWYSFSLLMARHLNMEKLIYRMVLSEEMQGLVGVMLQMAEVITSMMKTFIPTIGQLQTFMASVQDLNLGANQEFDQMARGYRSSISSKATFVTLSRALCSKGILALLGVSKLTAIMESNSSQPDQVRRGEMINRFKIPQDASPFCMNMYLDMVNTTGGAIAWAFLKPMLMGHILYTPDTPATRAIMEKANSTLNEFANLRKYSEDWIESSNYLVKSAVLLSQTLPLLQNSLSNSFVQRFIEMQTDINVDTMKETLSNFSNMTAMLEKNKHIMDQVTTLSTLMVNLSSCITFDRYRGYDTADELNAAAQHLAKNRDLYASVIFKLPKDTDASRKRNARASSSTSTLPPKVSYTIRMHMDNLMRTDRVRDPYFMKDHHISARRTLRYNRGFVYLQENIDRAIIETQTGHRIEETAVQLQPFPYPCHYRDEYLEAVAFVFPLMLMIAWVLFVADFVKKLVHERELRLHEYMKMMGVNPLSHFFAWFLECASYLVLTVFILTLVLKYGDILPHSNGFILFLYLCNYSLSILSFSYLVSSFFDKTYIAGLSGSLLYILCFFPFIVVLAVETDLTFSQKSALSLFSPTCFSYASQYISRFESQGEGLQWSNSYTSPIPGDTASFGWLCWLMLIDSILYFIIGCYIRMVFPGNYGIASPWYFPFKASFWADLCCCCRSNSKVGRGLLFTNIMQKNQPVFSDDKGKGQSSLSSQTGEDFSELPVGVALHGLSKMYGDRVAIQNLNVSFYEGHVTSLLGHNGAGKTTTMSLLTGLFAPTSGTIEVYGRDMQTNIDDIRRELGVCMQYDVLFDHMTTKEHLLLYGQIKAPHWSQEELREQVRSTLEETGMYAHRHKLVSTLSGGMKRKLSISIAFIGGSRLVVLDEPTAGVDPCSRRNIWDIVIQHKKHRTVIMSTHHLDEAEVLSDRIAFLERGGLKCCGSPFHLKDKLGQGYKLTLTKKAQNPESEPIDNADLKVFIQAHVPEARMKEAQGGDLVYSLPPFKSSNASSYRSLLTALDANLDALQLGGYGISDTTLEEVFLQLTHGNSEDGSEEGPLSISETVSDTDSIDSFPSDSSGNIDNFGDKIKLTGSSTMSGMALAWQQMTAILVKRFHHSRRDWKGLIAQILLPVLFMVFAMGLGSIKSDLQHYPELELSPALYNLGPSYSFFSNQNPSTSQLTDTMLSYPGIDNACLDKSNNLVCTRSVSSWNSRGNGSKAFSVCKCSRQEQVCDLDNFQPPHKKIPSSQIVYNLSGINVEKYLVATANNFIRNRYGGFSFGESLPHDLKMDLTIVPKNRTLSKVWYNPEGHHTMPAYLNSLNNIILRSNLPADKDQREYAISVSSHPYFGRADDEDSIIQGMLQIMVAMCVLTGYSITTASFAIYEVSEHHSGSKRLQHISGISEPMYWTVNFFYDMVMYLIPVTLTVAVIAAFQIPAFTEHHNLGAVTLLLVLFGFATFPWMYLLSGIFKDAEMAFIVYVCINLFISINTIMSTSILYFLSQISSRNSEVIQEVFNRLSEAFLIFPQFNFGNGLMKLARMNIEVQLLSGYGIDAYKNPLSMDGLGWMFFSSFIEGVVFFTLRLLLNRLLIRKVRNLIFGRKTVPQVSQVSCETEDEDVVAEHQRVSSGAASTDVLQVNQLTKVYQQFSKKVPAVNKISVGIPAGECFGLLGVNGAGKTTTFKMLTGDVSPTDGTAQIRDRDGRLVDIMECRNEGINIGYCPQVDALDDLLTGKEHLYFYARIRGISKKEIDGVVNYLLKRLELSYHKDIITDGYSCGTRRKLSTALALIGHPKILLLDEPSSGMDPRTKRHLWKIISEEVKGKCAVVLTSHSMEECEALCSRLAIMVKGQFCCLGSLQHIKNRFGSGFTVKMYLAEASCDAEAITVFMRSRFPSTYLKDQHSTMVEYHVPTAPGGVADIFDQLESNKNALQIKHFSVSQTTLDEVFINFALGTITMESISLNSEDGSDDLDSIKAVDI